MNEEKYLPLDLPSKCLVYNGVDPSKVQIRTLKGKDQMIIAETTYENFEKKMALVVNNVLKGIKAEDLTVGDRLHVLLWLTINSRKKTITIKNQVCEHCWKPFTNEVDLSQLDVIELPEDFKEPLSVRLPSGTEVQLKLFRVKDEIEISNYEANGKSSFLYRYARSIVDDKMQLFDKVNMLENMDAADLDVIRAFHQRFFHGPKLEAEYKCPECGGTGQAPVPFRLEMLFPYGEELERSFGDPVQADVQPSSK